MGSEVGKISTLMALCVSWHGKTDWYCNGKPVSWRGETKVCSLKVLCESLQLEPHVRAFLSPWVSHQIRKIAGCACAGNAGDGFLTSDLGPVWLDQNWNWFQNPLRLFRPDFLKPNPDSWNHETSPGAGFIGFKMADDDGQVSVETSDSLV